jgi:DNA-binding XRE family transcriptional regulator
MSIVAQERIQAKAPPERTLDDVYAAVAQLRGDLAALRELLAPSALYAATDVADHAPNGAALRLRRCTLGLSQQELSVAAHVGRSTVAELERGKRHSIALRLHLAAVLDRLAAAAAERPLA